MKSRSNRLSVEALDDRLVPAAAFPDFNNDGLMDVITFTSPTTMTVSLANPDGSYTVSATLTTPKNLPLGGILVSDTNGDGKLDISSVGLTSNRFYEHTWLGNGDGTFNDRLTDKPHPIHPHAGF